MRYIVRLNETVKLNETSGTLQNADSINCVELSNNANFADSILLHPHSRITFSTQLYARLYDNSDLPVELRVVPFAVDGVAGGSGGTVTIDDGEHNIISDNDFNAMLDDLGI